MAEGKLNGSSGQRRRLFARRQVYLRAGQDSQYVELSPLLQVGVTLGFGVVALWLIGASYAALTGSPGGSADAALLAKLSDVEQERDAALIDAEQTAELQAALADAEARADGTGPTDQAEKLAGELEQVREEAEDLRSRLSESRADQTSLQARLDAETAAHEGEGASEEVENMQAQLEDAFVQIAALQQERETIKLNLAESTADSIAKDEATQRNTGLLATATAEIKRLRNDLAQVEAHDRSEADEATLAELTAERDQALAERDAVERELTLVSAELEEQLLTALNDDGVNQRSDDLLRAATTEIERLQTDLVDARDETSRGLDGSAAAIGELEKRLSETTAERDDLAEEVAAINAELEEAREISSAQQSQRTSQDSNSELLRAATDRIETLQDQLAQTQSESGGENDDYLAQIEDLEEKLDDASSARADLQREIADLNAELEEFRRNASADDKASITDEANFEALSIAAGLKEADLMATIEDLRSELEGATTSTSETASADADEDVQSLMKRLATAEAEIERLLLAGLNDAPDPSSEASAGQEGSDGLRAELLTAQSDIIKLNADVKAAKQRLASEGSLESGQASQQGNFVRLEQQLVSTRSRMQQLNKALADAKLREVAVDLALISVVPTPSPPAPR